METITPEKETIEYLEKMKLEDIFPKSLDLENKESNKISINEEPLEFNENNDNYDVENIKLVKDQKFHIKLPSESTINCICSYNNILLIASNAEVRLL